MVTHTTPADSGGESVPTFSAMPRPTQISAHIAAAIEERIASRTIPLGARLLSEADLGHDAVTFGDSSHGGSTPRSWVVFR